MKIYAINGGPRKKFNTVKLLQAALDGAAAAPCSEAVETEMIHLYDLNYKGCVSCFSCKRLGGKSYGHCAVKDDLAPVLEKLSQADGLIFGSPIYFGNVTGMMRSFLERLLFPFFVYDKEYSSLAPKRMPTAFIYPMNVSSEEMEQYGYSRTSREWNPLWVAFLASRRCSMRTIPTSLTTTASTSANGSPSRKRPLIAMRIFRKTWKMPAV